MNITKSKLRQIKSDIAIRKKMCETGFSKLNYLDNIKLMQETSRSFDLATVESLVEVLEQQNKDITDLESRSKTFPPLFFEISHRLRTQDNQRVSNAIFCVYEKLEIIVDANCEHDRITWIDDQYREAKESQALQLMQDYLVGKNDDKWHRVAFKDIDIFVTSCFTEHGCKDFIAVNRHKLRKPFISVKSGLYNLEYQAVRNWLYKLYRSS